MSKKHKPQLSRPALDTQRYHSEKYVEYIFAIEVGILETATLLPNLTDDQVLAACRGLVGQVRQGGLPRFTEQPAEPKDLLNWLIAQSLERCYQKRGRLSQADLAGCLEVVIESASTHLRRQDPRHYLDYLRRFMRQMGVNVRAELAEAPPDETLPDFDQIPLAALGRWQLQHPAEPTAANAFYNRVLDQIVGGQAQAMLTLCQPLLAKARVREARQDLLLLIGMAHRALGNYPAALSQFEKAQAQAEPDTAGALGELAETYTLMGEHGKAIQAWLAYLDTGAGADTLAMEQVALLYRAAGDLESEEAIWRDLLEARKHKEWWNLLWRRQYSPAVLYHLVDCLKRRGKPEAAQQAENQLMGSAPHRRDPFDDWAYWVRYRLEHRLMVPALLSALRSTERAMRVPAWNQLLRACIYDWQGQPEQSAPLWAAVQQQFANRFRPRVLVIAREVLGGLLPATSPLFGLTREIPQASSKHE